MFGALLRQWSHALSIVAGLGIAVMGLHFLGAFRISALFREKRIEVSRPPGLWSAYLMGLAFAFGWTPCLGPILTLILGFASQEDTLMKGILLLAVYSLGLAVPFLMTSLLMERFLKFYSRFRSHMHALEVASGGLLIALGVLLVIGRFTLISSWLSFLNRFAL